MRGHIIMTSWRRILTVLVVVLFTSPLVMAQDVPLGGKVKSVLLGAWVKVDEPSGLTYDLARENCDTPLLSESYLSTPGRASFVDELPNWRTLKGDLALFEHDQNLYVARPSGLGFEAALHAHPRMLTEAHRSLIVGVHTWSHRPESGFSKTANGTALDTVPVSLAISHGSVGTEQFYLQIGQRNDTIIATLLSYVDRNAGRTDQSVEYVRCGDISGIVSSDG